MPAAVSFYQKFLTTAASRSPDHLVEAKRWLARNDLFFLLTVICKRRDMVHPWIFDRCREVEGSPDGHLDLWAREHFKSTIITFGLTILDILASHGLNPEKRYGGREVTVGILSFNNQTAADFLRQIKTELETNADLKALFPDILFAEPRKEARRWSVEGGLVVKRKTNPKEATIEASGLVDGQPTGKHYFIRIYDDVVVPESVATPEQIAKTNAAWELSDNLGTEGGRVRYIGTRYHLFDTYSLMMQRGVTARVHPCTSDGSEDFTKAVLKSPEFLAEKRQTQGPYTFGCLPGDAPVLMADMTDRAIRDLCVGDMVIGYEFPKNAKTRMRPARVVAKNSRPMEVFEFTLASGRTACCTADHKWFSGRRGADVGGADSHKTYSKVDTVSRRAGDDSAMAHLVSMYDPSVVDAPCDATAAAWLGGFFDGEGAVSGATLHFHQSDRYPAILDRIESSFVACKLPFSCHERAGRKANWRASRDYYLTGGREIQMRFLRTARPAKAPQIVDAMLKRDARVFTGGKANRDPIVSKRSLGVMDVFNIETETGNYVAYGYATKNSQMLLNPTADRAQGFQDEWWKTWPAHNTNGLNVYTIVDPASGRGRKGNDYTSMWVVGLGADGKRRILDGVRDRLNLQQRQIKLFDLVKKWGPLAVFYEEVGLQADIEHMRFVMQQSNFEFRIVPISSQVPKADRIRRLVPVFEAGRILMPEHGIVRTDVEGRAVDIVRTFRDEEYLAFPVCRHDDALDCLAWTEDPKFRENTSVPLAQPEEETPVWMRELMNDMGMKDWQTA